MCCILKLDHCNMEIHIAIAITYSNDINDMSRGGGGTCHYFLIHLSYKM